MHELSIASSLLDLCLEKAAEAKAVKITNIKLKIGKLSGVVVHFLKEAFEAIKTGTIAEKSGFEYFLQDVKIFCGSCQKESLLKKNIFKCPLCESIDIKVTDGEDLILMNLELEI